MLETLTELKQELDAIATRLNERADILGSIQNDIFKRSEKLTEAIDKLDPELDKEAIILIERQQFEDEEDIAEYFDSADFLDIIDELQQLAFPPVEQSQRWRLEPYPWPDGSTSPLQTLP